MILPNFILHSRKNLSLSESGMDSYTCAIDRTHFNSYPYSVTYKYNSRGFRDEEWPNKMSDLEKSVWCFGDSFTVGIGSPLSHTWTNILQSKINKRCINISLDGASNFWIARKATEVLNIIQPKSMIIQWSYLTRQELNDESLSDEDRRILFAKNITINQLKFMFLNLISSVESNKNQCNIIHSFVPGSFCFSDTHEQDIWQSIKGIDWPEFPVSISEFNSLDTSIVKELHKFNVYELLQKKAMLSNINYIPEIVKLDNARDSFHYDIITATDFVTKIINKRII